MKLLETLHEHQFVLINNTAPVIDIVGQYIASQIEFHSYYKVALLAPTITEARGLLISVYEQYEKYNPPAPFDKCIKQLRRRNMREFELDNESCVQAGAVGMDSTRGQSYNLVFINNFSHVKPEVAETFYQCILPVLMSGTKSKLVIASGQTKFDSMWQTKMENRFYGMEFPQS